VRRLWAILLLLALVAVAVYSGWRVRRFREGEEEARLRRIHTASRGVSQHLFHSDLLGGERRVWVFVPPGYDTETPRRYPVLYLQDGQSVFDGATARSAGMEWQADETAGALIDEGRIEPLIIVALDNAGPRRNEEYTPTPADRGGGGAARYRRALVEEVKPWVDGHWRTRPGPRDTGIAGSSLGGLVSLWIGLSRPDVFSRIASLSTPAWWDDELIVSFVQSLPEKPPVRIWTDIGTREGWSAVEGARHLHEALVARGWRDGVDLQYVEARGAPHDESAWAKRLPDVLEFLYPPRPSLDPASRSGPRP